MKIDLREIPIFQIRMNDRKDFAKAEMERLGLKVKSIPAIITKPRGIIGCGLSHVKTLRGAPPAPFLVLEDDAMATDSFRHELEVPDEAQWVFLGVRQGGLIPTSSPGRGVSRATPYSTEWHRVEAMLGTHAVIYLTDECAKAAADLILDGILKEIEIDTTTARMQHDFLALTPAEGPWFYQAAVAGGNEEDSKYALIPEVLV